MENSDGMPFSEKILAVLCDGTELTAELLYCVLTDKITSKKRFARLGTQNSFQLKIDLIRWKQEKQKYYTVLNRLKNDGLIEKIQKMPERQSFWQISLRGKTKQKEQKTEREALLRQKDWEQNMLPVREQLLFIFDIPEKKRKQRVWLRITLKKLKFARLQKSVWTGKHTIPKQFIKILKERGLLEYIHIFSVVRHGTLKQ